MIVNQDPIYPSYASPACIECIKALMQREAGTRHAPPALSPTPSVPRPQPPALSPQRYPYPTTSSNPRVCPTAQPAPEPDPKPHPCAG